MNRQPAPRRPSLAAAIACLAGALLAPLPSPAAAQDVRGLERCTAETRMERRTGCLQANVEFLQQELMKLARDTQDKLTASQRDLAAARAEIAALKTAIERLTGELAKLKTDADAKGKK